MNHTLSQVLTWLVSGLLWWFAVSFALARPSFGQTISPEIDDCSKYQSRRIPKFKVVRKVRTGPNSLALFISISPAQTDRDDLITPSCHLGRLYAEAGTLSAWILDSKNAAKRYNPQGEGNDRSTESAVIGLYGFSKEPGKSYGQAFEWRQERSNRNSLVHIDLGAPPQGSS
jgi:hypothetical protein